MSSNSAHAGRSDEALRRARDEMRRRIIAGQPCRAEEFFAEYPSLALDTERALDLICTEYALRRELGEQPTPTEWGARFPHWRDDLARRFQVTTPVDVPISQDIPTTPEATTPHRPRFAARPAAVGRQLDRYTILEEIGHGGMGVVYKAHDPLLDRTVALKIIRGGVLAGEASVERFYLEAQATARLDHAHIVKIHDIGLHDDQPYFTMAYVGGGSLARQKDRYRNDPKAAAELVEALALAVQHAHERNIIHRDLKPANVLLDDKGQPQITDFGLAKILGGDAELTQSGQLIGTPAYMAPEQAKGAGKATAASDVWSLGVILYELLTGRRPFEGQSGQEVTQQVVSVDPVHPRSLSSGLDANLEAIVLKCLEKDEQRRYRTAEDLARDLRAWRLGEPITARPETWLRRNWRKATRNSRTLVVAVVLLVLGGIAATAYFSPGSSPRRLTPEKPINLLEDPDALANPHWIVGSGTAAPVQGGGIRLEAKELGLLELHQNILSTRYRYRIRVQDLGSKRGVGMYFMAQKPENAPGKDEFWFIQFMYKEQEEPIDAKGNKAAEAMVSLRRLSEGFDHYRHMSTPEHFPGNPGVTRTLQVDITPEMLKSYWENQPLPWMRRDRNPTMVDDVKLASTMLPQWTRPVPTPPVHGSLGLICERGSALVHEAVIEPLPSED